MPLTAEDIDAIAQSSFDSDDPLSVAARLVEAVEQEQVDNVHDARHALLLAAEITDGQGDLEGALALVDRAISVGNVERGGPHGYPWATRAELLLRLGREDEAMADFARLRPLLGRDPDAVSYISEALDAGGRAEIAEQWLTAALETLLDRSDRWRPSSSEASVAYALAQERFGVRRDLGRPLDDLDELALSLQAALEGADEPDEDDYAENEYDEYDVDDEYEDYDDLDGSAAPDEDVTLLFWPRDEFDRIVMRWPAVVAPYGRNWDEHRAGMQRKLVSRAESGRSECVLVMGVADELAEFAVHMGGVPVDPLVCQGYAEQLGLRWLELDGLPEWRTVPWPPGRNDPCWCGSGTKYKKCCLTRSRG